MQNSVPQPSRSTAAKTVLWAILTLTIALAAFAGARSLLRRGGAAPASTAVAGFGGSGSPEGSGAAAHAIPIGDPLPDFTMTDRSGRTVSAADLRGKVWIANFIFTRCSTVCPTLSREMAAARTRLAERGAKDDVLSVSFTIDPLHDTPDVLKTYAQEFHADPATWLFLTSEPAMVVRVVREGFHLMMSDPGNGPPMHSNRFVLVDAEGRVRSSHLATDEGAVDAIVADALALREEARSRKTAFASPFAGDAPVRAAATGAAPDIPRS